jgi:hypothetical protein
MNKEKPKSIIEAAFSNPKAKLYKGSILIPSEPLDMETVMRAAIETEDEQDELDCDGSGAFLEKIGWPCENICAFYWQSMGPMVWECYLNILHLADDTALIWCYQDGDGSRQGIALVKQPSNPAVMSAFFKALIKENGDAFGLGLFGSLPSNTDNKIEELIPEEIVRAAYWDWMKWAESAFDVDWLAMAEEVSARERSPIMYPRDLLKNLFAGTNGNPRAWLEEQDKKNGRLSLRAKRAIFDAYFKQSYGPY